jgi:hypothetical protein
VRADVLTVLLNMDLLLISYAFVTLNFHAAITSCIYSVICMVFLGLREVAVAMSNPFGDDEIDFDLEKMLAGAFKNAIAILRDPRPVAGSELNGLVNPVTSTDARFTVDASKFPAQGQRAKQGSISFRPSKMTQMTSVNEGRSVAQNDNV